LHFFDSTGIEESADLQAAVWVEGVNVHICVGESTPQKLLDRLTLLCVASVEEQLYAWTGE
jgi:hypothetical protein